MKNLTSKKLHSRSCAMAILTDDMEYTLDINVEEKKTFHLLRVTVRGSAWLDGE